MLPPTSLNPLLSEIDWSDSKAHVTPNFTVYEACWLPSASCLYWPTQQEREELYKTCLVMEKIRALLGKSVIVHVMIRPEFYNKQVGGAPNSQHMYGKACDFHVRGMSCDLVREVLRKNAEQLGICIENRPGSSWVHIDLGPVRPNGGRFFSV